ncbi:hypothetical protein IX332_001020 [Porphyromonas levii]|uniref:DUF4290 domain-containing protein n=1 Tax=Porphyromonas levii TaxID=28114 RepID=UPI001B8ADCC9|nr:DUF4290 domain-containing protein [Porphyromonas levii]MBR8729697.1 hypothetical protein [Porphyromonas levii]
MIEQDYYTENKVLILPEYGRNIQNMVEHCLTIEDREERQACAESIIETMNMVSGRDKERDDYWQVLWDHLYIMSDFKLDVDFPYVVTTREEFETKMKCAMVNEQATKPAYRHYGKIVERMIEEVLSLPEGAERDTLAKETALQMKRSYIQWNKETVTNAKIFADLFELSEGKIYLDEMICSLPEAKELLQPSPQLSSNGGLLERKVNKNKKKKR